MWKLTQAQAQARHSLGREVGLQKTCFVHFARRKSIFHTLRNFKTNTDTNVKYYMHSLFACAYVCGT